MDKQLRSQVVFHLTGRRPDAASEAAVAGMRPALLAPYRHLEDLRYDFPLVLCGGDPSTRGYVRTLSGVVDELLRQIASPGVKDEGLRRRVLKLEREIRRRLSAGKRGTLTQLWDAAAGALAAAEDEAFARDLGRAREALAVDGELIDCDEECPERFVRHAWRSVQLQKAERARQRIGHLVVRLADILRADYMRSSEALKKTALEASFGGAQRALFDFDRMNELLSRGGPRGGLGEKRRGRVEWALGVLKAQRFFAPPASVAAHEVKGDCYEFAFDSPEKALAAFRQRLPALIELLKALQVAELEADGNYSDELHDAVVGALDEQSLTAADLEFFPDYLVCVAGSGEPGQTVRLADAFSSGVPLKIVVQVGDLLEESAVGQSNFAFGLRSAQLAIASMSLDEVFVLQSSASNLLQMRERVARGLLYPGPALFSLYAAPSRGEDALPPYLDAAAAMQSRAFPAFSYDPGAGSDLASRFSLENNPQPERDWPLESFSYADAELQTTTEDLAFTFVDFVACNPRHARHFSPVPPADWGEGMLPLQQWLDSPPADASDGIPYLLAVDGENRLCRLVVDDKLIRAAQRCREAWHRLQELGGIRDPRTQQALARERQAWDEQHRRELEAASAAVHASQAGGAPTAPEDAVNPSLGAPGAASMPRTASGAAAAPPAEAAAESAAEPERNPDEPYIETIRCSTCNECTQINPRMFSYNENKQAYIADLKAGSYKEMVEAAESCQLSIIHPGKPWDPNEPGLEALIERAAPFQ
jgi:ferredoxin